LELRLHIEVHGQNRNWEESGKENFRNLRSGGVEKTRKSSDRESRSLLPTAGDEKNESGFLT